MNAGLPDLPKKVIWEKSYFLESSKVWGLIKPKRKAKKKKWD